MSGFVMKQDRARGGARDVEADAADIAYARHVLDDPDTEWIDWNDVKRELAAKGD